MGKSPPPPLHHLPLVVVVLVVVWDPPPPLLLSQELGDLFLLRVVVVWVGAVEKGRGARGERESNHHPPQLLPGGRGRKRRRKGRGGCPGHRRGLTALSKAASTPFAPTRSYNFITMLPTRPCLVGVGAVSPPPLPPPLHLLPLVVVVVVVVVAAEASLVVAAASVVVVAEGVVVSVWGE